MIQLFDSIPQTKLNRTHVQIVRSCHSSQFLHCQMPQELD